MDNIVRAYHTVEVEGAGHKHVLVVETDLPLGDLLPGFDPEEFAELVDNVRKMMEANGCDSATVRNRKGA